MLNHKGYMKKFFCILAKAVCILLMFLFSDGIAADKRPFPESPPEKISKKWRIGYLQGGPYKDYQIVLSAIAAELAGLGWIENLTVPKQENDKNTDKLWNWLSANANSRYLEFAADAYYSAGWNEALREENKTRLLKRLNQDKDIDLMIAMGTMAGQDLANNDHSVPTVVCSVSDAIAAKIVKSAEDSGYDHIHACVDPTRFERQIRAFHDIISFKKLGVAFRDTLEGRSIAGINDIRKVARERNFEILECHTLSGSSEESLNRMIQCARELAAKADAFYLVEQATVTPDTLSKILDPLNLNKIPTFSQSGSGDVRQGVLLSVAGTSYKGVGKFHAETIAKIINGAKPRDLDQVFEAPIKIAFNLSTAKIIGLKEEVYDVISGVVDEVYETGNQ